MSLSQEVGKTFKRFISLRFDQ